MRRDAHLQFADRPLLNPIVELAVEMDSGVQHLDQQGLIHADELSFPCLNPPRLPTNRQLVGGTKRDTDKLTDVSRGRAAFGCLFVVRSRHLPTPAPGAPADLDVQIVGR